MYSAIFPWVLRSQPWIGSEGHWRRLEATLLLLHIKSHLEELLTSFGLKTPQDLPGGAEIPYGRGAASQNTASTVSGFKRGGCINTTIQGLLKWRGI